jgi:hypothetical protein
MQIISKEKNLSVKVGDKFTTNEGYEIEVIEYDVYKRVKIRFNTEFPSEKYVAVKEILKGNIKNPYHVTVRGVGFWGVGPYTSKVQGNPYKSTKEYVHWSSMLTRCYTETYQERFPTYIGCSVDRQWHNYQEFAEWCNWQIGFNEGYVLDKDILIKGNKVYSPETCVLVPPELNSLVVTQVKPGKDVPAGISFQTSSQKYIVSCAIDGKNKNLGRYKCPEEAFAVYKGFKENLIRERAEKYKDKMDIRAYHALTNYVI